MLPKHFFSFFLLVESPSSSQKHISLYEEKQSIVFYMVDKTMAQPD